MSKYLKLKNNNQKRFNDFSEKYIYWIFAFNDKEFEDKLKEHGLTKNDIISIGFGGFIKKEHKDLYLKEMNRLNNDDPFKQVKDDDIEVKKAFIYELANHEYCITYNLNDTLDALGITTEEIKKDKKWLEEHRQSSANNIGDSEFHIFDMPTRILCGKDIYDEMLNMISSYDLRNVKQFGFQKNNK